MTCGLLIESLILKSLSANQQSAPEYIKNFVAFVRGKHIDFIIFGKSGENHELDENNLIEAKKGFSANNSIWRNVCSALNRIFALITIILYLVMTFTLIPFQYADNSNPIQQIT